MADWNRKQAEDSAKIFETTTKSVIEQFWGGKTISTENHDNPLYEMLDFSCDIDAVVQTKTGVVFGIAHRVNTGIKGYYRTFTIHTKHDEDYKTEIDKMQKDGWKPRYHVQTACDRIGPKEIAIVKSKDLLYAIDNGWYTPKTSNTGQQFYVLYWDELIKRGIHVDIYNIEKGEWL